LLKGYNDLTTTHPELMKEWSPNNIETPWEFMKTSNDYALWICPVCHGEYSGEIRTREVGDDACPYCRGFRVLKGFNDLVTTNPELDNEWSFNNETPPEKYQESSSIRVLWECPKCHGEYSARIKERDVGDDACPFCRGIRVQKGVNDLATTHPELAKEWSANNEDTPENYRKTYWANALWECPKCHGEYNARIRDREVGDDACPYCRGHRVLKGYCTERIARSGYNTFAVKHRDMLNEWLFLENSIIGVNPDAILDSDNRKVWWQCPNCERKYYMTIKDRLKKGKRGFMPCPFCNGRRINWVHFF